MAGQIEEHSVTGENFIRNGSFIPANVSSGRKFEIKLTTVIKVADHLKNRKGDKIEEKFRFYGDSRRFPLRKDIIKVIR